MLTPVVVTIHERADVLVIVAVVLVHFLYLEYLEIVLLLLLRLLLVAVGGVVLGEREVYQKIK